MIITYSMLGSYGRLGNQLFEIASLLGLADRHKATPLIQWKYKDQFNLPDSVFGSMPYTKQVVEDKFEYLPNLIIPSEVVDVVGTLQSEKYWKPIKDKVREYLTPINIKDLGENSVGIHVRRGDYVDNPNYINYGADYYLSAIIEHFNDPKYTFYVCSDDIGYCKSHFKGTQFIIEERSEVDDLKILAGCQNHIICNSSFSWWGAYLSNSKKVIRPPKIFSGNLTKHNESDFWIEDWIVHETYIDLRDVTFIIPVKYDHPDRKENLNITLRFLKKFDTNIILGEQGDRFRNVEVMYKTFPYQNFHRTRMLNRMTMHAKTPIVVNWDADILLSPFQIWEMVQMLRGEFDFIYPYDGRFLRVGNGTYERNNDLIKKAESCDVGVFSGYKFVGEEDNSVGGVIGYKKSSFIEAGMENEYFIAYSPEDVERFYRFKTLGYTISRVDGPLYHLNHFCSETSSTKNPYYQLGVSELKKVQSFDSERLKKYVSTWPREPKVVFICYANDAYKMEQDALTTKALSHDFDKVYEYSGVGIDFYNKNKQILDKERGAGYWLWKPYIILETFKKIEYGDIVLYMDSGDDFKGNIRDSLLNIGDFLLTDGAHRNEEWTHKECFKLMGCDEQKYKEVTQLEAGIIAVRKTMFSEKVISEWLSYCENPDILIDNELPQIETFKEHRHDQSILTNLKVKYNLYSSSTMREFVTCNVTRGRSDCTFIIPLFYDGRDRLNNINTVLKHLKNIDVKVIVGEQLNKKFENLQVEYVWFDYKEFHRTKMINELVRKCDSTYVAICDADVILPEDQYYKAMELLSSGVDVVYPYSVFVKLDQDESEKLRSNLNYPPIGKGVNSLGGLIFFNRKSYIEGGMENEVFKIWGREDLERYERFKTLGYKIERIPGNLYHLYHPRGANSSAINPYSKTNMLEYQKVSLMNKDELTEYVKSWKKD